MYYVTQQMAFLLCKMLDRVICLLGAMPHVGMSESELQRWIVGFVSLKDESIVSFGHEKLYRFYCEHWTRCVELDYLRLMKLQQLQSVNIAALRLMKVRPVRWEILAEKLNLALRLNLESDENSSSVGDLDVKATSFKDL